MDIEMSGLLPLSNNLNPALLRTLKPGTHEYTNFMVSLVENINEMLLSLNSKDIGIYTNLETISGQKYNASGEANEVAVLRKVIDFGSLPNSTTKSVAHGLTSTWKYKFTRIYATASDSTNKVYLPIPYSSSTSADIIELHVDNTNVNIKTGKDRTSYDTVYVVIEYIE